MDTEMASCLSKWIQEWKKKCKSRSYLNWPNSWPCPRRAGTLCHEVKLKRVVSWWTVICIDPRRSSLQWTYCCTDPAWRGVLNYICRCSDAVWVCGSVPVWTESLSASLSSPESATSDAWSWAEAQIRPVQNCYLPNKSSTRSPAEQTRRLSSLHPVCDDDEGVFTSKYKITWKPMFSPLLFCFKPYRILQLGSSVVLRFSKEPFSYEGPFCLHGSWLHYGVFRSVLVSGFFTALVHRWFSEGI